MALLSSYISRTGQEIATGTAKQIRVIAPSREIVVLGVILATLQILDGVLTGFGVAHLGLEAEGNPLLHHLMHNLGYVETLILTKTLSIAIICALCYLATVVQWLKFAMRVVIVIYVGAAIIPWSLILASRVLS